MDDTKVIMEALSKMGGSGAESVYRMVYKRGFDMVGLASCD